MGPARLARRALATVEAERGLAGPLGPGAVHGAGVVAARLSGCLSGGAARAAATPVSLCDRVPRRAGLSRVAAGGPGTPHLPEMGDADGLPLGRTLRPDRAAR